MSLFSNDKLIFFAKKDCLNPCQSLKISIYRLFSLCYNTSRGDKVIERKLS